MIYDGRAVSFAFYPQGELLMTGDGIGTATAFRTSTGERRTQIPYPPAKDFMSATERVGGMEVAFSKSGKRFVAGGAQGTIEYTAFGLNALEAEVARWDYRGFIHAVAFADDDRTVIAFNNQAQVLMLEPPLQLPLLESVNFTSDGGAVAAMSFDWEAKLYATARSRTVARREHRRPGCAQRGRRAVWRWPSDTRLTRSTSTTRPRSRSCVICRLTATPRHSGSAATAAG